jgi:hypothetical protein
LLDLEMEKVCCAHLRSGCLLYGRTRASDKRSKKRN